MMGRYWAALFYSLTRRAIGHEITQHTACAANAAGAINQLDDVAATRPAAKLAADHDVGVARKAGAPAAQFIFVNQIARYAIEQDVVANTDAIVGDVAGDARHRAARDLAAQMTLHQRHLVGGERIGIGAHRRCGAGGEREGQGGGQGKRGGALEYCAGGHGNLLLHEAHRMRLATIT